MFKRFLIFAGAAALVYAGMWVGAAFWLKSQTESWAQSLRTQGYTVDISALKLVGFPTRVGVMTTHLRLAAPATHGGWRWEAGATRMTLSPTAPRAPVIDLTGTHRIAGLVSAPDEGLALTVDGGAARIAFASDGTLDSITLDLKSTAVAGAAMPAPLFHVGEAALHLSLAAAHATLAAREIVLPDSIPVLGDTLRSLDIALDVTGTLPSGPLTQALETWRAAGGAVEIRSFAVDWPPAGAAGTGTFALDDALQPMGAFTVKFRGFFEILEALTREGYVREREASLAKIVLGMMARPSSAGGPSELALPLTLQDRKLHAGPVMLMDVPTVVWDAKARIPD